MNDCRCGKPTRDQAFVCDHCLDQLNQALAETPWLNRELNTTLTGQTGVDYRRGGGSRTAEHRLPIHLAASQAQSHLRATLVAWTRFCHDENVRHQSPNSDLPADTVPAMSRYLMWRVDGLGLLDIGPDAVDEITKAVRDGKRVVDRPADKWYVGPCEACGSGMYATPGTATIKCRAPLGEDFCGHLHDVASRRAALLVEAEDRLASAHNVARAVSWLGATPLTAARVRKWAERDRIFAKGHDGRSPLYRIGDAIDLLASETKVG